MSNRSIAITGIENVVSRLDMVAHDESLTNSSLQALIVRNPFLLIFDELLQTQPSLICMAENVFKSEGLSGDCILVSPSGGIVVAVAMTSCGQMSYGFYTGAFYKVLECIKSWSFAELDRLASDYFYSTCGQGFRMIDKMAQAGYLKFSDGARFTKAITETLSSGNIQFVICSGGFDQSFRSAASSMGSLSPVNISLVELSFYKSEASHAVVPHLLLTYSGEGDGHLSETEFISRFSSLSGIGEDDVIGFVYLLAVIDGVSVSVSDDEMTFYVATLKDDCRLFSLSISGDVARIYTAPMIVCEALTSGGLIKSHSVSFMEFLMEYADLASKDSWYIDLELHDVIDHTDDFVYYISRVASVF